MSNESNTAGVVEAIDDRIIIQSLTPEECVGKTVKAIWEESADMVIAAFTDGTAMIVEGEHYDEDDYTLDCDTRICGTSFIRGYYDIDLFVKMGLIDIATAKELLGRHNEFKAARDLEMVAVQPLFAVRFDRAKCQSLLGVTFTDAEWVEFIKVRNETKEYQEQVSEQLKELTKRYYSHYKSMVSQGTPSAISE